MKRCELKPRLDQTRGALSFLHHPLQASHWRFQPFSPYRNLALHLRFDSRIARIAPQCRYLSFYQSLTHVLLYVRFFITIFIDSFVRVLFYSRYDNRYLIKLLSCSEEKYARVASCNVLLRLFYSSKLYLCTSLYTNCEMIMFRDFLLDILYRVSNFLSRSILRDELN